MPKQVTESSFSWHALFPPGTFVPPHIHANQDEFIYVLEGRFDLVLDGKDAVATAGDLIRLPMKIMHGIFNKSDQPMKCLFWVSPTGKLFELFQKINNVPDPAEVTASPPWPTSPSCRRRRQGVSVGNSLAPSRSLARTGRGLG